MDEVSKLFDLTGEVAIVTGGLGMLGSEFTKVLTQAGAKVVAFDIKPGKFEVNITKKGEVQAGFEKLIKELGVPTILINNAGLDSHPSAPSSENGRYEDYPEESWDSVIDSHLNGMHIM
ncbi:MAG: SDR family NAD(P)-dependent oxidoreductase [Patescibacteria group bacterium]